MYIDPNLIHLMFGIVCFGCGVMAGYHFFRRNNDIIIGDTIDFLIEGKYIKHRINEDGEVEIIPLKGDKK